ncbi:uncharacterized protein LOC117124317 [Anneissia japonica]|uniref:uncharacterized protein LOC117124317 n=1 Tax=Anneissia japonica TaxID=1529436 RepID=UPI0014256108|nr:uncharacterized protein LOC117124317 [Anneissia japonica]
MAYTDCFVWLIFFTTLTAHVYGQWNTSIQLQGGLFWGYIQVLQDNQLKYICNDYWDIEDGRVACRQLGLGNVFTVEGEEYSTKNTIQDVFLCNGNEATLMECPRTSSLSSSADSSCTAAYVSCGVSDAQDYDWKIIGCFQDDNDRILPDLKCDKSITGTCRHCLNDTGQYFCADYNGMTVDLCLQVCCGHGYAYAGLENGDQCFCGSQTADYERYGMRSSSECSTPCKGNSGQECGGVFAMRVYECILPNVTTAQQPSTESILQTSSKGLLTTNSDQSTAHTITAFKESPMSTNELRKTEDVSDAQTTIPPTVTKTEQLSTESMLQTSSNGQRTSNTYKSTTPARTMTSNDLNQANITSSIPNDSSETPATLKVSTDELGRGTATTSVLTNDSSQITLSPPVSITPVISTMDSSKRPPSTTSDLRQMTYVTTPTKPTPLTESYESTTYNNMEGSTSSSLFPDSQTPSKSLSTMKTTVDDSITIGNTSPRSLTSKPSIQDYTATDLVVFSTTATKVTKTSMSTNMPSLSDGTTKFPRSTLNTTTPTGVSDSMATSKADNDNNVPKDQNTLLEDEDQWYLYMILAALCLIPILILLIRCCCWNVGHRERHKFDYSQSKGSKKKHVLPEDEDCDSIDDNCIITSGTIVDEEDQPVPIPSYRWVPMASDNKHLIEKDTPVEADPVWNIGSNDGVVDNEIYEGGTDLEINAATPANGVEGAKGADNLYSKVDFSKKKNKRATIIIDSKSFSAP